MGVHVKEAVMMLPPAYRMAISLRYLEELSYEEMAEILELPMGTVKNRLFRAREKLKDLLSPKEARLLDGV
ncbi:MAG: sigma-70 family RNA polymerase sigma factor, partial [Planctomycetota bacterium]|jgi:RNA polymerase sigma-70 factor (ECF subfamily)